MKGIILAGGTGSRLKPVSLLINKSLLPIYNRPSIYYALDLMRTVGITEICIIAEHNYVEDLKYILGNGADFRVQLHFESDSPMKKGPASALYYGKRFIGDDNFLFMFADGNYDVDISESIKDFIGGAVIFTKSVLDPHKFGVVEIDKSGEILSIEEKPGHPKSNLVCTGMAIYDKNAFDYIEQIGPGLNGEYYTTDIDKIYLRNGKLKAIEIDGFWQDVGTFDGLLRASNYWYFKSHGKKMEFI